MRLDDLPPRYVPFGRMKIRTNVLDNATAIFSINGFIPLLIGQGFPPRVWLSLPTNKEATDWVPLIKENFSSHPDVKVEVVKKRVLIKARNVPVIHVIQNDEGDLIFMNLDLRPFGLDVYTDDNALHVMGSTLSGNTFKNVGVAIGIGQVHV